MFKDLEIITNWGELLMLLWDNSEISGQIEETKNPKKSTHIERKILQTHVAWKHVDILGLKDVIHLL